jgi:hypothetical protein
MTASIKSGKGLKGNRTFNFQMEPYFPKAVRRYGGVRAGKLFASFDDKGVS